MRITTIGPADRLGAAILPIPARDARAYQSRGTINGSPGTTPIPAPTTGMPQHWTYTALHKSGDAPDYWRPSIYYQRGPDGTHPQVSVESDNQMPIPARDGRGRPAVMARRPRWLGQQQIGAVNTVPRYPWIRG